MNRLRLQGTERDLAVDVVVRIRKVVVVEWACVGEDEVSVGSVGHSAEAEWPCWDIA